MSANPVELAIVSKTAALMAEGLDADDIAASLGVRRATVPSLMRRARLLVRRRTPPLPAAYRLAQYDPIVRRALELYAECIRV